MFFASDIFKFEFSIYELFEIKVFALYLYVKK